MAETDTTWRHEARFWLIGDEDDKRPGHIGYSPQSGPIVHLPKSMLDPFDPDDRSPAVPLLHGETLDEWPFTLLGGRVLPPDVIRLDTQHSADIAFAELIRGPHVEDRREVSGRTAHVTITHLKDFLRGARFDTPLLAADPEDRAADHRSVAMPWGSLGLFAAGGPDSMGPDHISYRVSAHAQFHFDDELPLDEVDELIDGLRDLVAFSARRPTVVQGLTLFDTGRELSDDWRHRPEYEVIRAPHVNPDRTQRPPYALLLNPATVPSGPDVIARWYALRDDLGPVWSLFFSTLADHSLTTESSLLNIASFAEGYHRTLHDEPRLTDDEAEVARATMLAALPDDRHRDVYTAALGYAHGQSQRARIRWLARRAAKLLPGWELEVQDFTSKVVDTRNWLVHFGDRGDQVQEGDDLAILAERLYVVLVANILLDLGLDDEIARHQIGSGFRGQGLP